MKTVGKRNGIDRAERKLRLQLPGRSTVSCVKEFCTLPGCPPDTLVLKVDCDKISRRIFELNCPRVSAIGSGKELSGKSLRHSLAAAPSALRVEKEQRVRVNTLRHLCDGPRLTPVRRLEEGTSVASSIHRLLIHELHAMKTIPLRQRVLPVPLGITDRSQRRDNDQEKNRSMLALCFHVKGYPIGFRLSVHSCELAAEDSHSCTEYVRGHQKSHPKKNCWNSPL
jgi:hypothetical protein